MSLQCVYVCLCLSMFINVYLCYFVDFKFTNKLYQGCLINQLSISAIFENVSKTARIKRFSYSNDV